MSVKSTVERTRSGSGADRMPFIIVGNCFAQFFDKARPFRARPNKTHVSADYIEELWQLVKTGLTDKLTNSGDTGIIDLLVFDICGSITVQ